MVAQARGLLYDPRWPWHAAAELGASVEAAPQSWRCQPSGNRQLFGETISGARQPDAVSEQDPNAGILPPSCRPPVDRWARRAAPVCPTRRVV